MLNPQRWGAGVGLGGQSRRSGWGANANERDGYVKDFEKIGNGTLFEVEGDGDEEDEEDKTKVEAEVENEKEENVWRDRDSMVTKHCESLCSIFLVMQLIIYFRTASKSSTTTIEVASTAATSIHSTRMSTPNPSVSNSSNFDKFDLLLSLDTALELIHADRDSLKRVETFAGYPGQCGHRVHDTIEEIFVLLLQALGERHVRPGFERYLYLVLSIRHYF